MRSSEKIGLSVAAGAGTALFAYAGIAATAWLRYGRHQPAATDDLLGTQMPQPEVIERHSIAVNAPAEIAYDAARNLDLMQSPLIRAIFATREALMCAPPEERALPRGLVGQVEVLGWRILEEVPGKEIVIGAAAKPWLADPAFRGIEPHEFDEWNEPGWAKIAWNFAVEPVADGKCIVRTETRVVTTDRVSRKLFRRYWAVTSPGIALIRRLALRNVKRSAETRVVRADGFEPPTPSV